jgi:anaerobic selenocysteine-containing dehydrogenase
LFTVVLEQFQTDTADYADIVLPATTFLEHTDLYLAYGHYYLQMARPAVPAAGEAKPNVEVFRLLARRLGFTESCFDDSDDDLIRAALATDSPYFRGISLERLDRERSVRLAVSEADEPFLPFADGQFQTPSGKFEFGAETMRFRPPCESRLGDSSLTAQFPLELISSKNDDSMNSTFGHRVSVDEQTALLKVHPLDAEPRGISNGALVVVFNQRGRCFLQAEISTNVKQGTVSARSVRWNKRAPWGFGVNQLTADRLTDIGSGATFYSCLVEVQLVPAA